MDYLEDRRAITIGGPQEEISRLEFEAGGSWNGSRQ